MIVGVIAYPMILGFLYGFTDSTMLKQGHFIGLENYIDLLAAPDFRNALLFSLIFALFNVIGCYALGLGLALLMNEELPFRGFFRVALLLPWIVPSIVSIVSMAVANCRPERPGKPDHTRLRRQSHLLPERCRMGYRRRHRHQDLAKLPFMMLSLLAAIQGSTGRFMKQRRSMAPHDGRRFIYITMPQLKNISIVLCPLMTIWTVNDFDTAVALLTQGGPANATENLVLLAYRYTFGRNDVGMGSAVSFTTPIILMVLIVFTLRAQRER